ncbi:cancer/testis antigen 55-like [Meriones unguiculatus]|uniref:cancer/testis antigen 55-like n=1 Tax=Meriones unguiculatus TaxID=10047 RepID=UPI00293EC988|nr:cancer/testis antigen 55-like [Meriones unguiculatus]
MLNLLRRIYTFFQRNNKSEEAPEEQPQENSKLQSIQGVVTSLCTNYGWINKSIFFHTDVVCDNVPLRIGVNVIGLVEEDETTHVLNAIKVKIMNNPVDSKDLSKLGKRFCIKYVTHVMQDNIYVSNGVSFPIHLFSGAFRPFKGDLVLVAYSMIAGTSDINIQSVRPLSSQNMQRVCITRLDGRTGVVEPCMFFSLDSLHTLPGYTPALYDIVNVIAVDSIHLHYSWRVVSMIPIDRLY